MLNTYKDGDVCRVKEDKGSKRKLVFYVKNNTYKKQESICWGKKGRGCNWIVFGARTLRPLLQRVMRMRWALTGRILHFSG